MKIYENKDTGLRMRVPGCRECPNRVKTRFGTVCIALEITEGGLRTGFYEEISEESTVFGGHLFNCPLEIEGGEDEDEDEDDI